MSLDKSVKQSFVLGCGTAVNALLGLAFYLLVIRNLSVGSFGEFTFLVAIGALAYEIADLGINSSILKFGHGQDFSKTITFALYQRLLLSSVIFLLAFVAQIFFGQAFLLSALLASALLFFSVINQAFIVSEKYLFSILYNVFANTLRLLFVLIGITQGIFSVNLSLWIASTPYLIIFLAGFIFIIKNLGLKIAPLKELKAFKKTVLSFSIWIGGSQAISSLSAKIGSPLLFALSGPVQTGLYGSAQTIAGALSQFAGVLDSVFAPKLSKGEDKSHFKTLILLSAGISILIICSIPFVRFLVTLVFPSDYLSAIPVLEILLIGYALFFLSIPFSTSTVYKLGKSQIHLASSTVQLVFTIGLYLILVPRFGAIGAAETFVLVNVLNLLIFFFSHLVITRKASK